VAELKAPEAEAEAKILEFINNDTKGWVLHRRDLQCAGVDVGRYDTEGTKRVLHAFESAISKAMGYEIVVSLGSDGRFYRAMRGDAINVGVDRMDVANCILTHNHPMGTLKFSYEDIAVFYEYMGLEIRAVTPSGGVVSLRRKTGGSKRSLMQAIKKAGFTKEMNVPNEWLKKNAEKYGYFFSEGCI